MKAKKRECEIETRYLVHNDIENIMWWIQNEHGLKCTLAKVSKGVNPSSHDEWYEQCIVVNW